MVLLEESLFLIGLTFNTVIFANFLLIEYVLKLNVFAYGKAWLRLALIGTLESQSTSIFLLSRSTNIQQQQILALIAGFSFLIWNPLYYHILVEQNIYWIPLTVKRVIYITLCIYTIIIAIITAIFSAVNLDSISPKYTVIVHYLDIFQLIILSITEFLFLFNIFKESQTKVKSVSLELWRRVQFCLFVCAFCIVLDFVIVTIENLGYGILAYEIKSCTFSFKLVFECLCFQFIKGIMLSLEQYTFLSTTT